ncbi:MAG: TonB-dependent receptor, partial [Burkholderiales bacterium]|nr:TonB-dependent receptor [Burkholderiales bacterium]
ANKNWKVTEKVTTAFTRLDIDSTLMGIPVRGNAGVQLVHTDQGSDAYQASTNGASCPGDVCALAPAHGGTSYYDVLPSVNLVGDLGSGQTLRLGLGRQMARPTLNDMRASFNFSWNSTTNVCPNNATGCLTGDAGNPALKPFRATALDVSYEKYFGTKAYFSAAAFYKSLSSYILRVNGPFDYAGYNLSAAGMPNANSPTLGSLSRPMNGTGGNVEGIELSASLPLSMATSWLDGFGIQASFSNTNSSLNLNTLGFNTGGITLPSIPLPGLSKQVANLTFYYEAHGFSARIGQRYRSDFLGNITSFTGDSQYTFIHSEKITDAQISYEFESGPMKGLSVLVQGNNLTNTPYIEYLGDRNNPSKKVSYGKTFLFGLNYKL